MTLLLRFIFGGIFVSLFAILGDSFKPKTFSGIFGAAPSIAIAGLILTRWKEGSGPIKIEAFSMVFGAAALAVYSLSCSLIVRRTKIIPWVGAGLLWAEWLLITLGIYEVYLRNI